MKSSASSPSEIQELIDSAVRSISDPVVKSRLTPMLRSLIPQTLMWEYGNNESFTAWRFAYLGEREIWAAFCSRGHGERGAPWGLVFAESTYFRPDESWYPSLQDLLTDWFD